MNTRDFIQKYNKSAKASALNDLIKENTTGTIHALNLCGSTRTAIIAQYFANRKGLHVIVMEDEEKASYAHNDLSNFVGAKNLLFFPSGYKRSILHDVVDSTNVIMRTEVLNKLMQADTSALILTYPEALVEKVVSGKELKESILEIHKEEKVAIDTIVDIMQEYAFERVEFVFAPGQYSLRGSIVDIFSYSHPEPYRLDFFGDEVESIRTFDTSTQLSKEVMDVATIIPNLQVKFVNTLYESVMKLLPPSATVWFEDSQMIFSRIDYLAEQAEVKFTGNKNILGKIDSADNIKTLVANKRCVEMGKRCTGQKVGEVEFNTSLQPSFSKNFELLGTTLEENTTNGYTNIFFTENINQVQRLEEIFKQVNPRATFSSMLISIHEGYVDHDLRICCYTDHQVFERFHGNKVKEKYAPKESISIQELRNLNPGDYVVHIDNGIGKFSGLVKVEVNGKEQECIKLVYSDNDVLFVGIHNLHKISKYKSKDGTPPKLHKLGSGIWERTKQKTKGKVKDIAKDLIALYAERRAQKGFAYSPDSYMQQELEASFFFEDTPDQLKATRSVKRAMESDYPMDMLVCGDVGFGKTEVAVRAAFKAVADNKQVAVLVPTTILALQHYQTFSSRLKDFPCTVEYVSRLRSAKQMSETLKNVAEGRTDILIGTHRIVSKDVKFKDLGLLVIDEEQKFGVGVKEKLKQLKVNVDSLTLTATPIPRTLQFSLMGARDLAIINTPPPNRHPIVTELHNFNEQIIREAIEHEMSRGGQVFFIHNKVHNIFEVEAILNKICPKAKTIVGHGQMEGERLEEIMLSFINGDFDVLIATTIIESGLDIPNANTILINDAQNFGLSDLHQLRGRVGRSNKKAFAYLLVPSVNILTQDARRRLTAVEEFSELGSGFNIALQDLDIRGAGDVLGGEQSGFISDIGFETYQKILNEALHELRENEFMLKYENAAEGADIEIPDDFCFASDCHVDADFELMLPDTYVESPTERVKLYRELDNIENEERLGEFRGSLEDRFGKLPAKAEDLLDIVRLRWVATRLGVEKVQFRSGKMTSFFISSKNSPFFQSKTFGTVLNFVAQHPHTCALVEKNNRLTLAFDKIPTVRKGLEMLNKVMSYEL